MRTSTLIATLVLALLLAGAGAGSGFATTVSLHAQQSPIGTTDTDTGTNGTATTATTVTGTLMGPRAGDQASGPNIIFNSQQSSGQAVFVQSATLPRPGFIVIYDSTRPGNATNQIIGASYLLQPGTNENIRIQLDTRINQSKSLTAVVHTDTNRNGQFDYISSSGKQDSPLTPRGDQRIVALAQITVQNGTGSANTPEADTPAGGTATTIASGSGDEGANRTGGNGSEGSNGGSGAFGPGFGLVVGIVALIAIALLAVRRN
jgi:PGF-CTERM protein